MIGGFIRYRILSQPDNDFSFGGSEKNYYRDVPAAVGQAARTTLLLWLGEYFLDTTLGTRFLQGILGKHSKEIADATIRDRIKQAQGVVNISQYESILDPDTRGLSVDCTINTIYGVTRVELANFVNY